MPDLRKSCPWAQKHRQLDWYWLLPWFIRSSIPFSFLPLLRFLFPLLSFSFQSAACRVWLESNCHDHLQTWEHYAIACQINDAISPIFRQWYVKPVLVMPRFLRYSWKLVYYVNIVDSFRFKMLQCLSESGATARACNICLISLQEEKVISSRYTIKNVILQEITMHLLCKWSCNRYWIIQSLSIQNCKAHNGNWSLFCQERHCSVPQKTGYGLRLAWIIFMIHPRNWCTHWF